MMGVDIFYGLILSIEEGRNLVKSYCKVGGYEILQQVDPVAGLTPYMMAKEVCNTKAMRSIEKISGKLSGDLS
jgi:hypothetical protein